ncbi:hypothetical protein DFJ74DRAFT_707003 [Hyaloraphidium curvatum]|nr:hypothetical protein DFJ74DRAFT_707003 [Hyaloraphidium curvatum]
MAAPADDASLASHALAALQDAYAALPPGPAMAGQPARHAFRLVASLARAKGGPKANPGWPRPVDPDAKAGQGADPGRPLEVLVLDSSFDPPTRAHEALLLRAHTAVPYPRTASSSHPPPIAFDAQLLLLATTNMDKGSVAAAPPGRAGPVDRAGMMLATMRHLVALPAAGAGGADNVAVGMITAPRFTEKAACLAAWAADPRGGGGVKARWWFILGWDTVVRLFDPKYYPPAVPLSASLAPFFGAPARVVFASRPLSAPCALPVDDEIARFPGDVLEIPGWEGTGFEHMSSTEARKRVGDWHGAPEGEKGEKEEGVAEVVGEHVWEVIRGRGLYAK